MTENPKPNKVYENLERVKQDGLLNTETQAFSEFLQKIRLSCRHVDSTTNPGHIFSPTFRTTTTRSELTIKVKVWNESLTNDPVGFVCDGSATTDIVVEKSLVLLKIQGSGHNFILRLHGRNEYLCPNESISDFRYVQNCINLDQVVKLVLTQRSSLDRKTWARTPEDDAQCIEMDIDTVLPGQPPKATTYDEISCFLEEIDRESEKIHEILKRKWNISSYSKNNIKDTISLTLNTAPLIQPVKSLCVLLGNIQTVDIRNSLELFARACDEWNSKLTVSSPKEPSPEPRRRLRIGSDVSSRSSDFDLDPSSLSSYSSMRDSGNSSSFSEGAGRDFFISALKHVEESVRILVEMYSKAFPMSVRMKRDLGVNSFRKRQGSRSTAEMSDAFRLRIRAVHRLRPEWLCTYLNYILDVEMFHGRTSLVKDSTTCITPSKSDNNLFFTSLVYDSWVNFEHLALCTLPRECRLVFTLRGCKKPQDGKKDTLEGDELGWASIQCFNFKGQLVQGDYILPFWPQGLVQKTLCPAPNPMTASDNNNAPLLTIEFTDYEKDINFPEIPSAELVPRDFGNMEQNTQQGLKEIIDNWTFDLSSKERETIWEKRHYLHQFPKALPKVLLAAPLWDFASVAGIHAMLQHWKPMEPTDALQLLLPCFPDAKVREQAIAWISQMDNEELVAILPQMVEALSYEMLDFSPLAEFLLKKSLSCLKISHAMLWLLTSQVGLGKWRGEFEAVSTKPHPRDITKIMFDPRRRRLELMLNSIMITCGDQWRSALIVQYKMIEILSDIATQVKDAPSSTREELLAQELGKIDVSGMNGYNSFPLPMSLSYDARSIDAKSCSSFSSASVPIKINFVSALPEGGNVPMLFKKGDDLRQDMLTTQIIRVIEKWWLKEGLDFRVLTFSCIPTGYKEGVIEIVPNSKTLCQIHALHGITGPFQQNAIYDWLQTVNPTKVTYKRAVENFTQSCAAYCVLTYVLGICDRHNDNIMLTTNGQLFHIDFGKFLGDAQKIGKFKRDRTPFVLTSDMIYVINDGEKSSEKFNNFVDLCCQAFRIVRSNGNILVNLFTLMATAGIPGVDLKSVTFIQKVLLPKCTNAEAEAKFTRFIEDSLKNWFTPVNFFVHSLGQFKFLSEAEDNPFTLSFVPKLYSIEEDGPIDGATILDKKKYKSQKYYFYIIEVKRKGIEEAVLLYRTYKEFVELHTKLCINFPEDSSSLKNLPNAPELRRSDVKQVEEQMKQLKIFLKSLFKSAPEKVSHSSLVYTFFHPMPRDEVDRDGPNKVKGKNVRKIHLLSSLIHQLTNKGTRNLIRGRIKVSLEYVQNTLFVLIQHAADLACPNGLLPSSYVKTYLSGDESKITKRKTRVVRQSECPSFMETIQYPFPLDIIRQRTLEVSVWHYDPLQENSFLGGVSIPLATLNANEEVKGTYTLGNINFTT